MSLPIQTIPSILNNFFNPYKAFFTMPQLGHFKNLVTGLIVSENKTIQEINDGFGKRDQSNLNRFVSHSKWDINKVNEIRLKQVKDHLSLEDYGVIVVDESLLHKTGKTMELAGRHRSGVTKKLEWGHMSVNAYFTDSKSNNFPIKTDIYVREKDCAKYDVEFKTKREIAIEQIDYAIEQDLPINLIIVDAGYEGEEFTKEVKFRELDFIIGVRSSTKISINRQKRIVINEYLSTLTDDDFSLHINDDKAYFYHIKKVSMRSILVMSILSFLTNTVMKRILNVIYLTSNTKKNLLSFLSKDGVLNVSTEMLNSISA